MMNKSFWCLFFASLVMIPLCSAQNYPTKPVRIIVPFAPGGSADGTIRPIAEKLTELLGQSFVVENRPGGIATIGGSIVAKAEPDGHTLLVMPGTHVLTPKMMTSVPFHPFNDFTPIANMVFAPYVIVSARNQGFNHLKDLVQFASANPGKLSIGNSDVVTRLGAEMFSQAANIQLGHITYKGGGPVATDVLGGHLPLGLVTPVTIMGFYKDRKLDALAVTSPKRVSSLPDVPSVSEALGISGFDSQTWFALAGPAGMPRPVVERLSKAIAQALATPSIRDRLIAMGLEPATDTSPEGMAQLMKTFAQRNLALIDVAKIKPE